MEDVLGYTGRHMVVTGAASGMGAATASILTSLGARVTALDVQPTEVLVDRVLEVDLRDPAPSNGQPNPSRDRWMAILAAQACRVRRFPVWT